MCLPVQPDPVVQLIGVNAVVACDSCNRCPTTQTDFNQFPFRRLIVGAFPIQAPPYYQPPCQFFVSHDFVPMTFLVGTIFTNPVQFRQTWFKGRLRNTGHTSMATLC